MLDIIIILVITYLIYNWMTMRPKNFPPGPPVVPILGSLPFLKGENFHMQLEEMREKYGPLIGLKFGSGTALAVCGPKEVDEVLKRDEFQGRPIIPDFRNGVMFAEGQHWVDQRRFTLRHLRDFGFGKNSTESVILDEAEDLFENVLRKNKIVQVSGLFNTSAINVLWAMMGGKRYSHDDDEFKHLLNCLQRRFRAGNVVGGFAAVFPRLAKLFPEWSGRKEIEELDKALQDFLKKSIEEHKRTKGDEARDFIDVYLNELEKKEGLKPSFTEESLRSVCVDLFSAGAESVGNSLGFCLLYLVLYPEWQDKLYAEIESVIGRNGRVSLDHKPRMPLVEAFMTEVSRCNTIATFAVPHKVTQDCHLNGYFIPQNTFVLVSLWSQLQDKEHWKDPENFRPERFLKDGEFKKDDHMHIFGLGKRICLGESLARSSLFIFFIALVQEFKFGIPKGHPKPSTVCLPGFTNAPGPFEVTIERRE